MKNRTLLCLAPSPDDKIVYDIPGWRSDAVIRARVVHRAASGKGVNAARAAAAAGAQVELVSFASDLFRGRLESDMGGQRLRLQCVRTAGHIRTCTTVVDRDDGSCTELVEHAAAVTDDEVVEFIERSVRAFTNAGAAVLAGSLPPGFSCAQSADLLRAANDIGLRFVVDAHGEHLLALLSRRPYCVRITRQEMPAEVRTKAGSEISAQLECLHGLGAQNIVLSDGGGDVLLWEGHGAFCRRLRLPRVAVRNSIGSGDAMAGGIGAALAAGEPLDDAVLHGTALALANTQHMVPGMLDPREAARFRRELSWE